MSTITGSQGTIGILNVGVGDTKLSFDPSNPAECIRAARIVKDMLRRGYALLIEVEVNREKKFQRVHDFDETKCEYIIADFDPVIAVAEDANEGADNEIPQSPAAPQTATDRGEKAPRLKSGKQHKRIAASTGRGVAIARSAGG